MSGELLGEGAHGGAVRVQDSDDLERDRDLLLDLFGRNSWPLRDDLDVVVGDVGIRLDRQLVKRNRPQPEQAEAGREHERAIVEREVDGATNHEKTLRPVTARTGTALRILRTRARHRPRPPSEGGEVSFAVADQDWGIGAVVSAGEYPLSHLLLARAAVRAEDLSLARQEYAVFLDLWKNADGDLAPLIDARQEYARLGR
jgi:hypothetical protein